MQNLQSLFNLCSLQMESGKTKAPTMLLLPMSSNKIIRAWLKFNRPVLVGDATHEYIFCNKNGSAPRTSFGAQVRAIQQGYLGHSATPHSFRGMQVSSAYQRQSFESTLIWMTVIGNSIKGFY